MLVACSQVGKLEYSMAEIHQQFVVLSIAHPDMFLRFFAVRRMACNKQCTLRCTPFFIGMEIEDALFSLV
jgi:hypothetical protein